MNNKNKTKTNSELSEIPQIMLTQISGGTGKTPPPPPPPPPSPEPTPYFPSHALIYYWFDE